MSPQPWPLSAAATGVLQLETFSGADVLRFSLRELLWRRVWRIEHEAGKRGRPLLVPGTAAVPDLAPLPRLDAWLRERSGADGIALARAVRGLRGVVRDESEALRKAAREDLVARGLVTMHEKRVLGIVVHTSVRDTPAGHELAREAVRLTDGIREARSAEERAAAVAAAGALVLFSSAAELMELLAEVGHGSASTPINDGLLDLDFPSLDLAIDGGGGGGGGDGGGGGA